MLLTITIQQNVNIRLMLTYLFRRFSLKTALITHKSMWWWADTCSVVHYNQSSYHKWEISGTDGLINQPTRGGVEDTRLEAKDAKKNPRPRTAFPRTDTLEAKDRNARGPRTQAQSALQRKKGLHKNFSSDLHKKTFSKKFFKRFTKF